MTDRDLLVLGILLVLLTVVTGLVFWRLRRWSEARREAEQRAALALEEMHRLAAELRAKRGQA